MDQNNLFALGLGLPSPWKVEGSGLEDGSDDAKILYVDIDSRRKNVRLKVLLLEKGANSRHSKCETEFIHII